MRIRLYRPLVFISSSFFHLNKLVLLILHSPSIPKTFLTKTTRTQKHTKSVKETEYQAKKHFILSYRRLDQLCFTLWNLKNWACRCYILHMCKVIWQFFFIKKKTLQADVSSNLSVRLKMSWWHKVTAHLIGCQVADLWLYKAKGAKTFFITSRNVFCKQHEKVSSYLIQYTF